MNLEAAFKQTLTSQFSFIKKNAKILVAVSGGVDSMVLLHLLHGIGSFKLIVAHCNYQLREESNLDYAFVKDYCRKKKIVFVSKTFDTKTISKKKKISIQETARNLRYIFFDEQLKKNKGQWIATAHHKNDVAETILFNLIRGIDGLKGIPAMNESIIRPLLSFSKDEILHFAIKNNIPFREDSSNKHTKYSRNHIRHLVIPQLEKINPAAVDHIVSNTALYNSSKAFIYDVLKKQLPLYKKIIGKVEQYNFTTILNSPHLALYLNNYLPIFDLNQGQLKEIEQSLNALKSGIAFHGKKYTYEISRGIISLQLTGKKQDYSSIINVLKSQNISIGVHQIIIKIKNNTFENFNVENQLFINADALQLPLLIRTWKSGDSFKPFGFKGRKKVSDYLTDKKIHSAIKKETLVIADSENKIIGIIGYTIDDAYRIHSATKKLMQITLQ